LSGLTLGGAFCFYFVMDDLDGVLARASREGAPTLKVELRQPAEDKRAGTSSV